jgi:hypothetical protein
MVFLNRLKASRAAPNREDTVQTAVPGEVEADLGLVDLE